MLTHLHLQHFKSFEDEAVDLHGLTVLVGANGSGKSNLLDAIRFLQGAALSYSAAEILGGRSEARTQVWPGIRGGLSGAAQAGHKQFRLESGWLDGEAVVEHGLTCDLGESLRLTQQGVLPQSARSITFLELDPSQMRSYVPKDDRDLALNGENLSDVVWRLCQDPEQKRSLLGWLEELCAPELLDLEFSETDLGDVMLVLVEKTGRRIPARSMSDGTLRFLALLVAIRTAAEGTILLLEEMETGFHPNRLYLLTQFVEASVKARRVQVIATTHSPALLQWLSPEALHNAVLVGRPPGSTGSVLRTLGSLPHFDDVLGRNPIDNLFVSGWLEHSL